MPESVNQQGRKLPSHYTLSSDSTDDRYVQPRPLTRYIPIADRDSSVDSSTNRSDSTIGATVKEPRSIYSKAGTTRNETYIPQPQIDEAATEGNGYFVEDEGVNVIIPKLVKSKPARQIEASQTDRPAPTLTRAPHKRQRKASIDNDTSFQQPVGHSAEATIDTACIRSPSGLSRSSDISLLQRRPANSKRPKLTSPPPLPQAPRVGTQRIDGDDTGKNKIYEGTRPSSKRSIESFFSKSNHDTNTAVVPRSSSAVSEKEQRSRPVSTYGSLAVRAVIERDNRDKPTRVTRHGDQEGAAAIVAERRVFPQSRQTLQGTQARLPVPRERAVETTVESSQDAGRVEKGKERAYDENTDSSFQPSTDPTVPSIEDVGRVTPMRKHSQLHSQRDTKGDYAFADRLQSVHVTDDDDQVAGDDPDSDSDEIDEVDYTQDIDPESNSDSDDDDDYEYESESDAEADTRDLSHEQARRTQEGRAERTERRRKERRQNAAKLIIELLTSDSIGCSREQHKEKQEKRCRTHLPVPCSGLSRTYATSRPFLVESADIKSVGLSSKIFPDPKGINRSRFAKPQQFQSLFEGRSRDDRNPESICIDADHHGGIPPIEEFDIDSWIVFMKSFDGFRDTAKLRLLFTKHVNQNISTDLHIRVPIAYQNDVGKQRRRQEQIRRIPHLLLGTVDDCPKSAIYVLLPGLMTDEKKSSWLTDHESLLFFNAWLEACRKHVSAFTKQYLPPTAVTAEGKARAKGVEHRSAARDQVIKSLFEHSVNTVEVQAAWRTFKQKIQEPYSGLKVFEDAQIFVNVKNTKLCNSASKCLGVIRNLKAELGRVFVKENIHYWADIGRKRVPLCGSDVRQSTRPVGSDAGDASDDDEGRPVSSLAYSYLWKACCLEKLSTRLQQKWFGGHSARRKQTYYNGYLRDCTSLTVEPSARAWIRKAGLLYLQAYNSVKEIEDAHQVRPFDRVGLANLALAADLFSRGTTKINRGDLVQSYVGGKGRINTDYPNSSTTAMGSRVEVRVSGPIIDEMDDQLSAVEDAQETQSQPAHLGTPESHWCIPTAVWCSFMQGNFDKITSLIEILVLSSPPAGMIRQTSELLMPFWFYLKGFSNSNPMRKSVLWKKSRVNEGRKGRRRLHEEKKEYGFGMEKSINKCGFGWIAPVIDWQDIALKDKYIGNLMGCSGVIGVNYREGMQQAQDQRALDEVCHSYIQTAAVGSKQLNEAMKAMAHFILRAHRRDVMELWTTKNDVKSKYTSADSHDNVKFCHTGMTKVLSKPPRYVGPGSGCFAANNAVLLFELYMTTTISTRSREHFDGKVKKRFRHMVRTMETVVAGKLDLQRAWRKRLEKEFRKYVTIIPFPDRNGSFTELHTATHQRNFYPAREIEGVWRLANKDPIREEPPDYPATLTMSVGELRDYLGGLPAQT